MSRPMRLAFPYAFYHVTCGANARHNSYLIYANGPLFLETFKQFFQRFITVAKQSYLLKLAKDFIRCVQICKKPSCVMDELNNQLCLGWGEFVKNRLGLTRCFKYDHA